MREKIRILEGIWGGGGDDQEADRTADREPDRKAGPSETARKNAEDDHGSDTLDDDNTRDEEVQGERKNPSRSHKAGTGTARPGVSTPTSADPHTMTTTTSASEEKHGDCNSELPRETKAEERKTGSEKDPQRTGSKSGSLRVELVDGEAVRTAEAEGGGGGEMREDAGVDAWLISYNRRLKTELERLRGRTRQAEERLQTAVIIIVQL